MKIPDDNDEWWKTGKKDDLYVNGGKRLVFRSLKQK